MKLLFGALVLAGLVACAGRQAAQPAAGVPDKAPPPPGGYVLVSDGKPTWPPSGPGCEAFVRCCDVASCSNQGLGLFCQLAVLGSADCIKAMESVRKHLEERQSLPEKQAPIPAECKRSD